MKKLQVFLPSWWSLSCQHARSESIDAWCEYSPRQHRGHCVRSPLTDESGSDPGPPSWKIKKWELELNMNSLAPVKVKQGNISGLYCPIACSPCMYVWRCRITWLFIHLYRETLFSHSPCNKEVEGQTTYCGHKGNTSMQISEISDLQSAII